MAVYESKSFYVKTLEFYTQETEKAREMCPPILTELVFGKFDDYRLYDTSII